MKLYATVTGDRLVDGKRIPVSKGQGGNEYIEVSLKYGGENSNRGYTLRMTHDTLVIFHNHAHEMTIHHGKGEKQKGECIYEHGAGEICSPSCVMNH